MIRTEMPPLSNAPADDRCARAKPRLKIFQPVALSDEGVSTRAHLLNLSATGALVHRAEPPAPGSVVQIDIAGTPRAAHVIWQKGRRFGVAFSVMLADNDVAHLVDTATNDVAVAGRRIGGIR